MPDYRRLRTSHGGYLHVSPGGRVRVVDTPGRGSIFELEPSHAPAPLPGDTGTVLPAEPLPTITTRGRRFYAGGEPFNWLEASQFMLLKRVLDGEDIRDDLRWWKARGITMLRVLGMVGHPFWSGWEHGPRDRGYLEAVDTLCRAFGDEGLYLRFTVFADLGYVQLAAGTKLQHVHDVDVVLSQYPHVVVELANEPSLNGFRQGDPQELAELAGAVSNLVALGAEHGRRGHESTYDMHPADYVTFHAERATWEDGWAWVRRMGDYGVVAHGERAMVSGEPINAGDEGRAGDYEPNPAVWFAYGSLSRIVTSHGYAPCFHFHDGLYARRPTGATLECLDAFLAGCDAVPVSALDQHYTNGHWPASPWHSYDQTDPPSDDRPARIYGRGDSSNYIGVALRHEPGWSWSGMRYQVERVAEVGPAHGRKFAASVWRAS